LTGRTDLLGWILITHTAFGFILSTRVEFVRSAKKYFGRVLGTAISTPPRPGASYLLTTGQLQTPPSPDPVNATPVARHDLEGYRACADVRTRTSMGWIVVWEMLMVALLLQGTGVH
jgi:hypothetical protein